MLALCRIVSPTSSQNYFGKGRAEHVADKKKFAVAVWNFASFPGKSKIVALRELIAHVISDSVAKCEELAACRECQNDRRGI